MQHLMVQDANKKKKNNSTKKKNIKKETFKSYLKTE